MTYVGVRQLKTNLSRYLRSVRNGDEVVITDHGKPVARLIGQRVPGETAPTLASLAVEGFIILPTGKFKPTKKVLIKGLKGKSLSQMIIEDRR